MYEAQLEKDWKYVITDSDSKLILCANDSIYNVVKDYVGKVESVIYMYIYICIFVGKVGKVESVISFDSHESYIDKYKSIFLYIYICTYKHVHIYICIIHVSLHMYIYRNIDVYLSIYYPSRHKWNIYI
jgi:hypothetical protein